MFAPSHMAVGALCESGLRNKSLSAVIAFASHAMLDSTKMWHAPYPWPEDSPSLLQFMPYPHDPQSVITLITLILGTITAGFLLRRYWWGMAWAVSPDIIDWVILRPAIGITPVHDLFSKVTTPWGFGLEIAFVLVIVSFLLNQKKGRAENTGVDQLRNL